VQIGLAWIERRTVAENGRPRTEIRYVLRSIPS
jgi:hypothetical protein